MKKKILTVFIIILMVTAIGVVNAATASIAAVSSANQIIKGKTFTITISGTADENITALQSELSFDKAKLSLESKTMGTGFTDASGGDNEIAILSIDNDSLSKSTTLCKLNFKVLDNATDGETTISIKNAKLALVGESQEQTNVDVIDQNVTIEIDTDDTIIDTGDDDKKDDDDKKEDDDKKDDEDDKKEDNDKKDDDGLPQAGLSILGILSIIMASIFAVISYYKYKKYEV